MRKHLLIFGLVIIGLSFQPAHADPITAIITAITAGITWAAVGKAIVTAVVGAVISFGVTALSSVFTKKKQPSLPSYSFTDAASGRSQFVRSSVEAHKVIYGRARVSGTMVYVSTSDSSPDTGDSYYNTKINQHLNMVICIAGHQIEEFESFFINEDEVEIDENGWVTTEGFGFTSRQLLETSWESHVRIKPYYGDPDQLADPDLIDEVDEWTDDHRLRGIAYLVVQIYWNQEIFPNGIPGISAVIKGNNQIFDPRDSSTGYTDNAALCIRDYLTNSDYGFGADFTDEIDETSFIAAANICDESVNLAEGGTRSRYTCNGVIDTAEKPIDVLKDMASAMAGSVPYTQGKFRCYPGAYVAPSVTLDESYLAGDIEVIPRTPRSDLFNAIKGVYVDPNKEWQPTDFPKVVNALYQTQDGGYEIVRDLELPFTIHPEDAQRIAKIALEKSRQGILIKAPCNFKALPIALFDTVYVDLDVFGFSQKVFRVIMWELNADAQINLTLQEESSASYDWNSGEAIVYDPAPDTNLPDPSFVYPPGSPVVVEELYNTTNGSGIKARAVVVFEPSNDAFYAYHQIRYKKTSETDYIIITLDENEFYTLIEDLSPDTYNFEVRAVNIRNVKSAWVAVTKELQGLTAAPADVTNFFINNVGNNAHLTWDAHPDLDVRQGGSFEIRWAEATTGVSWTDGLVIANDIAGVDTNTVVPLMDGTYMIKAVDSTGNKSENATFIVSTAVNFQNFNAYFTADQHTGFAGTKTNMKVVSNTLQLLDDDLWDDEPGFFDDKTGNIDDGSTGNFEQAGEYLFKFGANDYFDFTSVQSFRVLPSITLSWQDTASQFDDAAGLFDDRDGFFDGQDVSAGDVQFYIRTTSDDPSGSPTYSSWELMTISDRTARAGQIKIVVTSTSPKYNVQITALGVSVDLPDKEDSGEDVAISMGGSTINFNESFLQAPTLNITIQGGAQGDNFVTSNKTATSFDVEIFDSGGSSKAGNIDWRAKGV